MSGKHGVAISAAVLVLGAIVLLLTWPGGGTPDDLVATTQIDAGTPYGADAGEIGPEEPAPTAAPRALAHGLSLPIGAAAPPPSSPSGPLPSPPHGLRWLSGGKHLRTTLMKM